MPSAVTGRLPAWAWPLLALPVVAAVGAWTYRTIAAAVHARLEASLQTLLASDVATLAQWLEAERNLAQVMADDPRVRENVQALLELSRRTAADPAALKAAPQQARLREILGPVVSLQENAGYFVSDPVGLVVARITDDRVGDRLVSTVADAVVKAFGGTPVFVPPTLKQRFASVPMAFLIVPMRDATPMASWSPNRGSVRRWRSSASCPRKPGGARRRCSRSATPEPT
jgi:hypothetical protein